MNKTEELMVITMEECGELTQACSKVIRRGEMYKNSDSEITFKEEVGDVFCMIELLVENGMITWEEIKNRALVKREKLNQWSNLNPAKHMSNLQKGYDAGISMTSEPIQYSEWGIPNVGEYKVKYVKE